MVMGTSTFTFTVRQERAKPTAGKRVGKDGPSTRAHSIHATHQENRLSAIASSMRVLNSKWQGNLLTSCHTQSSHCRNTGDMWSERLAPGSMVWPIRSLNRWPKLNHSLAMSTQKPYTTNNLVRSMANITRAMTARTRSVR